MAMHRFCDGVTRRDFLKAGMLTGVGLGLSDYLRLAAAGEVAPAAKAKSAIFIDLAGGPSHMDTFDLKPNSDSAYRGEFNPIATNVEGIEISEHLPKLAQVADKFTILRGVSHTLAAHDLGKRYMVTGNRPLPSIQYPGFGSVIVKELGGPEDLPPFIAIPNTPQVPGFLGVEYAALQTNAAPKAGQPFSVRGISLAGNVTVTDVERREKLLSDLDKAFEGFESDNDLLSGLDRFSEQAHNIIGSKRSRAAFDISKESPEIAGLFGDKPFGQSCLLATRLIEAGVRFATVTMGGWDTHNDNFTRLKTKNLPELDEGLAGLFQALHQKGLLESTAVFVTGEFGRTPKINPRTGRDHWPRAMFVLLAGGGFRGGRVLGASDENAMGPKNEGFTPDDIAASFYHNLGIDHTREYQTDTGRPIMIVRGGKVIPELFA
ncbi:MAG TPA: DUF1501 domain-containing protein [Planctomycetaceae bacterium]|nr:DUF1501 domain-containing protein [Planctomycetaceae bacterium]